MKIVVKLLLIFIVLSISSCKTVSTGFRFVEDKNIYHFLSGTLFPDKVSNFKFYNTYCYDGNGYDVSVGYNNNLIKLTHYIYPAIFGENNYSLEEHIIDCEKEIYNYHENIEFLGSEVGTLNGAKFIKKEYRYYDKINFKHTDVKSVLLLFKKKNWFIKLRITYPYNFVETYEVEIIKYLDSMNLPIFDL